MNTRLFPPSKRLGMLLHSSLVLALGAAAGWSFFQLAQQPLGINFAIFLLLGLLAFAPLPFLVYRGYALFRAQYVLNRDSLEMRWGLREENIPLSDIEWIRPVGDLAYPLRPPSPTLPGAVLGRVRHRDLGIVEFIASQGRDVLLVATSKCVFAISPADPGEFARTFSRAVELGSLSSAEARSVYPSFVFGQAWQSGLVRYLWLAALFLNIGLTVWTSLLIPSLAQVRLSVGLERAGGAVPSTQLVILPLLSVLLALSGWAGGLYYYRWEKERTLAMVIWLSSTLTSLLFLLAVLFIIGNPA